MFYEKGIATYIGKAVAISVGAILIAETVDTVRIALKARKATLDEAKKEKTAEEYDNLKKDPQLYMVSIKAAAKSRVERIKQNPQQEIWLMFCMLYFWTGHYIGAMAGAKRGFDYGSEGVDKLLTFFGTNAPDEMKALINKIRESGGTTDIDLTGIEIQKVFGKAFKKTVKFSALPKDGNLFSTVRETIGV